MTYLRNILIFMNNMVYDITFKYFTDLIYTTYLPIIVPSK